MTRRPSYGTALHGRFRSLVNLLAAGLTGAAIAAQSRVNGGLGAALGNASQAAVTSFVVTFIIVSLAVIPSRSARRGLRVATAAVRAGELNPGCFLAGLGAAAYVAGQTFSVPVVGVALFTVAAVGGQVTASLACDQLGLGPTGARRITRTRLIGAGLAILAIVIVVADRLDGAQVVPLPIFGGLMAGVGIALQMPLNGRVAVAARSSVVAVWLNAGVATLALLLLTAVQVATSPTPLSWDREPWYLYLGGVIAVGNGMLVTFGIMRLGVLALSICQITGVVAGALLLDTLLPIAASPITLTIVLGCVLLFAAAFVILTASGPDGAERQTKY